MVQLSPDGQWFWDGAQWRPAYSPDGRWRWDGRQWVPVGPPRWRYEPTEWTRRLQIIVIALSVIGIAVAAVFVPFTLLPQTQHIIDASLARQPADPNLDPVQFRQTMNAVVWSSMAFAGAAGLVFWAVILYGVIRLWRWVYWYLAVSYLLSLVAIPQDILYTMGYGTLRVPAWWVAIAIPFGLAEAALGAWMIVLYRRYGTWARRRLPPP